MGIKDIWKMSIIPYAMKDRRVQVCLASIVAAMILGAFSRNASGTEAKWLLWVASMACVIPMGIAIWKMLKPAK